MKDREVAGLMHVAALLRVHGRTVQVVKRAGVDCRVLGGQRVSYGALNTLVRRCLAHRVWVDVPTRSGTCACFAWGPLPTDKPRLNLGGMDGVDERACSKTTMPNDA